MNYIVLDLEWNQSSNPENTVPSMPFEIVEIGAVKLNEKREKTGEFSRLIKPQVHRHMHRMGSCRKHCAEPEKTIPACI